MKEVTRTERGWAGHLCVAANCNFRRNTLLECGDQRVVVSTVGDYHPQGATKPDTIGLNRYYETMAFAAIYEEPYWEANTGEQLDFESEWAIDRCERETDIEANAMHEAVVAEFIAKMQNEEESA